MFGSLKLRVQSGTLANKKIKQGVSSLLVSLVACTELAQGLLINENPVKELTYHILLLSS